MSNNPIEELRDLKVPVSEQEWEAIVHDKRYVKKFGRKSGLSPKGRAALIIGAAAVLITVPILVSTLSHKTTDTVQDNRPVAQTVVVPQPETANETTPAISPVTTNPVATPKSEETRQALPSSSSATTNAAAHEQSTLTAVTEARIPANNQPAQTIKPAIATPTTPQPTETISNSPKNTSSTTVSSSKKNQTAIADNHPKAANSTADENLTNMEKSPEEPVVEAEEFFIPTAFTPNGDGLNDLFKVQANFVPNTFEMSIFNRKGELMFLSQDMGIGWDGQFRGQTLPSGVYVCIIKYTDSQGNIQKKQGQVMLLP